MQSSIDKPEGLMAKTLREEVEQDMADELREASKRAMRRLISEEEAAKQLVEDSQAAINSVHERMEKLEKAKTRDEIRSLILDGAPEKWLMTFDRASGRKKASINPEWKAWDQARREGLTQE